MEERVCYFRLFIAAVISSRDVFMERIERITVARISDIYRKHNGPVTDTAVRVTEKYRVKRNCNA